MKRAGTNVMHQLLSQRRNEAMRIRFPETIWDTPPTIPFPPKTSNNGSREQLKRPNR